ncbi:MAG: hypothetical protein FJ398_10015 [Verrucomicrobia bacterium]|nr:hypothetical protein [Verrucomicrobiota bacterium]
MSNLTRRDFIGTTAAGAAALIAPTAALGAARKKIPIGMQLYSVRTIFPGDVAGTLAGIKKIGYEGVEFAGYANKDAKTLRQLLDDNGLKCCGTHIGLKTLIGDALAKSVSENSAGSCFRAKGRMARRNEGEYPPWIFD